MAPTLSGSSALAECDLEEIVRLIPGYDPFEDTGGAEFVERKALHAVEFFEGYLVHVKGRLAGKPFRRRGLSRRTLRRATALSGFTDLR